MQVKCYVIPLPKRNPELPAPLTQCDDKLANVERIQPRTRTRTGLSLSTFHFSSRLQNLKNKSHLQRSKPAGAAGQISNIFGRKCTLGHNGVPGGHADLPVMEWTLFVFAVGAAAGAGGNASLSTLWHICQAMCSAYEIRN